MWDSRKGAKTSPFSLLLYLFIAECYKRPLAEYLIEKEMELEARVREIVEKHLPDESFFIVEINISGSHKLNLQIILDGDEGINIDQCVKISRAVGNEIEEEELIDNAYNLEVASAGISEGLKMTRQYHKNVGRDLSLKLNNGDKKKGQLLEVHEDAILIEEEVLKAPAEGEVKKKKKKKEYELVKTSIPFEEIKKAVVEVSFR